MQNIKTYWDIKDAIAEMGVGPEQAVYQYEYYLSLGRIHDWPASLVGARTAHAIQTYFAVYYDTTIQECWDAITFYEIECGKLKTRV